MGDQPMNTTATARDVPQQVATNVTYVYLRYPTTYTVPAEPQREK